jgi:redox-sensitive bicupin YhaK (pirin superfamily)/outer membrane protein assembly factor BamB
MRTSLRVTGLAGVLATGALLAAGCTSGQPQPSTSAFAGAATPSGTWAYPNGDLDNTRDAAGSAISAANVASLREAWSFRLTGTAAAGVRGAGSLAANPVVVNGTVYLQDLDANVYAIALATGKLRWEHQINVAEVTGPGPDGVAVSGGVVYGDTPTSVFALNASTGAVIWSDNSLLTSGQGTFEIQPQVAGGRVYLASAYGSGPGGGVLMALDAASGKLAWRFNSLVGNDAPGVTALGLGSGGSWQTPLVGSDGSVTFGIGNPYQSIGEAITHPARQLYTDSELNLDAATGKLRWYYQAIPNDFMDHDMQASPIAADVGGTPAIIGSGKMGIVYAMNASTGALLWKTPVGVHNGTDDAGLLLLEHKLTIKLPYTWEPGSVGGVLTNLAVADGSVYATTINVALKSTTMSSVDGDASGGGAADGELEALNLATGAVEWSTKVSSVPDGAATVSNDLVFTTLFSGTLIALNRTTGAIVYRHALPTSTNAPLAIFGNTVLVAAGGPNTSAKGGGGDPQLVAYTLRLGWGMSNLDASPTELMSERHEDGSAGPVVLPYRNVPLGGPRAMTVRRSLPQRARSLIGAWCFVDHYGPDDVSLTGGMAVPGHPHTGLQTASWLFTGEVEHRDTTGTRALVRPGQLNLMTAGSGIAHSEYSTPKTTVLHGAQLWIALPGADRFAAPGFAHYEPPVTDVDGAKALVFLGSLFGQTSPVPTYSALVGAEVTLPAGHSLDVTIDAGHEHGILCDTGSLTVGGVVARPGEILFQPAGSSTIALEASPSEPTRVLALGGKPFGEQIVMWWNFIGRSHEEIVAFREEWQRQRADRAPGAPGRYGAFPAEWEHTVPAPELPNVRLRSRG